jgi:hypothetical protein
MEAAVRLLKASVARQYKNTKKKKKQSVTGPRQEIQKRTTITTHVSADTWAS